jgi:hypothetical protein
MNIFMGKSCGGFDERVSQKFRYQIKTATVEGVKLSSDQADGADKADTL